MRTPTHSLPAGAGLSAATLAAWALLGCGGSDDPPAPPPAAPITLAGVAAVGAALSKADVRITDASGAPVCQETSIVTSDTGAYSCTLQGGRTAPFIVVVTDPSGARPPMVSVGTSTPSPGTPLTVNVTPITTAIVAQLAPDRSALSVVANPSLLDTAALGSITTKVVGQLADVLAALNAPAGYDPFSTPITAATATVSGNTADRIVDLLQISTVNGVTTVATIDRPADAVPLAGATTTTPTTLPAPGTAVITLADAIKAAAAAFNACFALPPAQRALASNTAIAASEGGPEVTEVATDCEDIAHANYLHNGYRAGQQFYGLLHDNTMTGAQFSLPEVMWFIDDTTSDDRDRAVINIRYVDANGNAGNIITVAIRLPGSATPERNSDWWLWGNQQPVDTALRAYVRRSEQLAPNPGTAPFANAGASRYESGFEIFVNKGGPGSSGMRAARVTGPGLPTAGIVLTRPDPALVTEQSWLNIRNKTGNTDPAVATPAADVGNIFKLHRTMGLSGADATTLHPNPNAGSSNNTASVNWAHPLDYGAAPGTTDYIDYGALKALTSYSVEIFYEGETAPRHTFNKTLLTPLVPATRLGSLQWVSFTSTALAFLDPSGAQAGAVASTTLAWAANTYAETIRSAGVYTSGGGLAVNQGLVGVARGATSAVANAPAGASFRPLTSDGSSSRTLQLRYRMLDGSYKDSTARYN